MVSPAAAPAVPTLGPRALAFIAKSTNAKSAIVQAVLKIIIENKALSPKDFVAKLITPEKQNEIASLEQRVAILFKNILLDAMNDLVRIPSVLTGLMMVSLNTGDPKAHGKIIKEAALPIIKNLVADLDATVPGVIDEATSSGVDNPVLLKQFGLD